MHPNRKIRKALLLMAVILVTGFALNQSRVFEVDVVNTGQLESSVELESQRASGTWRYTKNGWQDISGTYRDSFVPIKTFELIHPLVWAASVLLAVIATSIWASSEWEFERLFVKKEET